MFIVFNKRKIYSYLVSFSTVVILFAIAFTVTTDTSIITSSTVAKDLEESKKEEISLNINCSCDTDNVNNIIQILKENNVEVTSFQTEKK